MNSTNFSWDHYIESLRKYGISSAVAHGIYLKEWQRPNRVYHGLVHLIDLLNAIDADFEDRMITSDEYDLYVAAAFVHDVVYIPAGKDNEDASIKMYLDTLQKNLVDNDMVNRLVSLVEATKYDTDKIDLGDRRIRQFLRYDLDTLCTDDIAKMVSKEELVFREFQFVDYKIYRESRSKMLGTLRKLVKMLEPTSLIDQYITYIHEKKRTIAIFPGSFNPMHLGHLDIINKAEKMFDKVIVAPGYNPNKQMVENYDGLKQKLNNQVEPFTGFLHDFVKSKIDAYTDIVVVKGMGRYVDFEDHKMQQRYIEDMYPNIKFAYIIPSQKVEHYASSAIRMIDSVQQMDKTSDVDHTKMYKF